MIYTRKTLATFVVSGIIIFWGLLTYFGSLETLINLLGIKNKVDEIIIICFVFGAIGVLAGIYAFLVPRRQGNLDYYMAAIPGALFVLLLAMFVKWLGTPVVELLSKTLGDDYGIKFGDAYIHRMLTLNHTTLGIAVGFIIANVLRVPSWAAHGVRLSRMVLKVGVILLGSLYSFTTIYRLGSASILVIFAFTLGTVALVVWAGNRLRISDSMSGVMSSGMGVCGVSATIAAAPVVKARSVEIAYTIGTILLWGLLCMLVFPIIGKMLGLNPTQFGAWAGTGILNSAQVNAAAIAYDPVNLEALITANLFSTTRVLFLPLIVLALAVWFVQRDRDYDPQDMNMGEILVDRFPIFVLGFVMMFALSSQGIFAPKNHYKGKYFSNHVASSQLLNETETAILLTQLADRNVVLERRRHAMTRLIDKRKIMSESDEIQLKGLLKGDKLNNAAKSVMKKALKAVRHTSKKVKRIHQFIDWLFTFGLVGLGMQITLASIRQAGGAPLILGGIIGTLKAVGSLLVIMYVIDSTVN